MILDQMRKVSVRLDEEEERDVVRAAGERGRSFAEMRMERLRGKVLTELRAAEACNVLFDLQGDTLTAREVPACNRIVESAGDLRTLLMDVGSQAQIQVFVNGRPVKHLAVAHTRGMVIDFMVETGNGEAKEAERESVAEQPGEDAQGDGGVQGRHAKVK